MVKRLSATQQSCLPRDCSPSLPPPILYIPCIMSNMYICGCPFLAAVSPYLTTENRHSGDEFECKSFMHTKIVIATRIEYLAMAICLCTTTLAFVNSLLTVDWLTWKCATKSPWCHPPLVPKPTNCHFSPSDYHIIFTTLTTWRLCQYTARGILIIKAVHTFSFVYPT